MCRLCRRSAWKRSWSGLTACMSIVRPAAADTLFSSRSLLAPAGRLICIDRDMDAIHACEERLAGYRDRVTLVHARYSSLRRLLSSLGLDGADGIFMDLGVSSHQLDTAARGFSFQKDAPLDMRMDTSVGETAKDLVNRLPADELAEILWKYGEERYSRRIAERIERSRRTAAIETTKQLADIIASAIPAAAVAPSSNTRQNAAFKPCGSP